MDAHTDTAATPDPRLELDSLDILACVRAIASTSTPTLRELDEDGEADPFNMEVDSNTTYAKVYIDPRIFKNVSEFSHCSGSSLSDPYWRQCSEDNTYIRAPYEICDGYCCSLADGRLRSKNRFILMIAIALSTGKKITDISAEDVSNYCDEYYTMNSEEGHNSGGDWPEYYSEGSDDPDPMDMARKLFNWCVQVIANENMALADSSPGKVVELL